MSKKITIEFSGFFFTPFPCSLEKYMVVAIKNEMRQFFPLGLSKMQKNNCTHSYRPILLIENFSTTTNGLPPFSNLAQNSHSNGRP